MKPTLNVLCLDIEGGHGGSSRSLYQMLNFVDTSVVMPEVWCKKKGLIESMYEGIGIDCRVFPTMPKVSALPKNSRNVIVFAKAVFDFIRASQFKKIIVKEVNQRFDLVHFNHEALFLLARYLRPKVDIPFTMHIRTNLWNTVFARWQTSCISNIMDHLVFITQNEEVNFRKLGGTQNGTVINNVVMPPCQKPEPFEKISNETRFKIAVTSNYSWMRGIDRLVDIARIMKRQKRKDFVFVVAGDMGLTRSLPGELGEIARKNGTLIDYARLKGVESYFIFLGHVNQPERVLSGSDMLIKPTRENNPWGRDILEAMAYGLPVASIGTDEMFVQDKVTGILQKKFDPQKMVDEILKVADSNSYRRKLGENALDRVKKLCSGVDRAKDMMNVWQNAAAK